MKLIVLACGLLSITSAHAAFSVSTYAWGSSDAAMGLNGFAIEDFEDVNLVTGFQVSVSSPNGGYGPTSTLPSTFKPSDDTFGTAFQIGGGGAWDGSHGLINTRTNQTFSYSDSGSWGTATFHFLGGASSAGFSVHQMDRDALVLINGNSIGTVAGLTSGFLVNNGRHGFMRIDASGSDVINTIAIQDIQGNGDGYMFDHVAFNAVPEPFSMVAMGAGLLALARRRRRA